MKVSIRRKFLSVLLSTVMLVGMFPAGVMAESETESKAWDGKVDFSWYNTTDTTFTINTPEQWAGLAWIVGGFYTNLETNEIECTGTVPEEADTFAGKKIILGADLNMGGVKDEDGNWSGPKYLPIGGTYYYNDVNSNGYVANNTYFQGTIDGQYHKLYNINCVYSSGSYLGLVGNIKGSGNIENLWIGNGKFSCSQAVGSIAGRFNGTGQIKNCVNEADVTLTGGTKGAGGLVGALWGGKGLENCANFGSLTCNSKKCAGLIGDMQSGVLKNCYNMGEVLVSNAASNAEWASLVHNYRTGYLDNCYYKGTIAASASNYADKTQDALTSGEIAHIEDDWSGASLAAKLNGKTTRTWVYDSSQDKVVPRGFTSVEDNATVKEVVLVSGPSKTEYVEGQTFDSTGIVVSAEYTDGTYELVEGWDVDKTEPFTEDDGKAGTVTVTVSGKLGKTDYSLKTDVSVAPNALDKVTVSTWPSLNYLVGDKVDLSSMVVKATYTNGITETLAEGYTVAVADIGTIETGSTASLDWTGKKLTASYTYRGETKTAESTNVLVVLSLDGAPEKNDDGYYVVKNNADFAWVVSYINYLDKTDTNIKLDADISTSTSIGPSSSTAYAGTFDGNSHSVTLDGSPLFKYVGDGTIKNITVKGTVTVNYSSAGGIASNVNGKASFENCVNEADVTSSSYMAGGMVCYVSSDADITMKNCVNKGTVKSGSYYAAGLIANLYSAATIENCENNGTITSDGKYAGGLLGYVTASGSGKKVIVKNCSNNNSVIENTSASRNASGGIIACVDNVGEGSAVESCFNKAEVKANGSSGAGGIIGYVDSNGMSIAVKDCYNAGNVTGGSSSYLNGAIIGGSITYGSVSVAVDNCYNVGTVEGMEKSYMTYTPMFASTKVKATNCYYLEGCSQTISGTADGVTAKTADEIKALASTLGSAYKENNNAEFNGGYPVLAWQEIPAVVAKANITVSSGTMKADGTVDLDVSLSNIAALDEAAIDCFTLYVTADEALEITGIDMNAGLCNGGLNSADPAHGGASFVATSGNITADGVLFKLTLKAADMKTIENGDYTVSVGVGTNGTVGSTDISENIKFISGKVTVDTSVFSNTAINVTVKNDTGSTPAATVTAPEGGWTAGANTFTVASEKACVVIVKNADGTYSKLTAAAVAGESNVYSFTTGESFDADCEIMISIKGDVDGDGNISQADYLYVLSAIRGASLGEVAGLRADIDGNGSMSQVDYLNILSAIRGASLNW